MTKSRLGRRLCVILIGCGFSWMAWAYEGGDCLGGSAVAAATDTNDLRWDLAESFTFAWESVEFSARIARSGEDDVVGPDASTQTVSISVSVHWDLQKARNLVILDVNAPQVYEMYDEEGNRIEYQNAQSDQRRHYEDSQWSWSREGGACLRPKTLGPFSVKVRLPGDTDQLVPPTISILKGYVWAVYADRVVAVDVPFDPDFGDLESQEAPDLTFSVDPTTPPPPEPPEYIAVVPSETRGAGVYRLKKALGLYWYKTWVKSKTNLPVLALSDGIRYPGSLFAFRDYVVIRTELLDSNRGVFTRPNQGVRSGLAGTRGAYCSGEISQSGDVSESFDTIRHLVAVHPVEVKIPFVLASIPVPRTRSADR
jgi:hypothetical protein